MNLETALEPRLWDAIHTSIEARKYTAAILEAIHLLTDVIRERSGLEGDGVALVGAAFGGDSPKLKVNRMRTESELSIQRGMEQMLRGLYYAIRNPRSHDAHQDDERDANSLLLFIDYLLRVVDKSGTPFSLPALVARVLDDGFVPNARYAELLVGEIPAKKRLAVCREVFARRAEIKIDNAIWFFGAILAKMPSDEIAELCDTVSQELRETTDEDTIRFALGSFPSTIWQKLSEIARLRIENKLIQSIDEGRWIRGQDKCTGGALATWASSIFKELTLKDQFWDAVFEKLESSDVTAQDYAFRYFLPYVERYFDAPPLLLQLFMERGLKAGDPRFKKLAESWRLEDLRRKNREPDHPWVKPFAEALANFKEAQPTQVDVEIPF